MSETDPARGPGDRRFTAFDDSQHQAYRLLREVGHALRQLAQSDSGTGSWLGAFTSRFARRPSPVTGIYLWGGVGRGKTHLMDAFFEQAPIARKRRLHFHHFMLDVHEKLARLNNVKNPLIHIARDYAGDYRIICLDEFIVTNITDAMKIGNKRKAK